MEELLGEENVVPDAVLLSNEREERALDHPLGVRRRFKILQQLQRTREGAVAKMEQHQVHTRLWKAVDHLLQRCLGG